MGGDKIDLLSSGEGKEGMGVGVCFGTQIENDNTNHAQITPVKRTRKFSQTMNENKIRNNNEFCTGKDR